MASADTLPAALARHEIELTDEQIELLHGIVRDCGK